MVVCTEMFLADNLSRAYLTENPDDFVHPLEAIDATLGLPVNANHLHLIQHATAEDTQLSLLCDVIKAGWPDEKHSVQPALWTYWDACDNLWWMDLLSSRVIDW